MTPSELREFLLNDTSGNSYAILISYNGETTIKMIGSKIKCLNPPCNFKKLICGTKNACRTVESKNQHSFLTEHYDKLEIKIIESSSSVHFPRYRFHDLCEKYKPTLRPDVTTFAEKRLTAGPHGSTANRVYRDGYQEHHRAWMRNWHEEHPEKTAEYCRQYRKRNLEKCRERVRKYRKVHREQMNAYQRRKRQERHERQD